MLLLTLILLVAGTPFRECETNELLHVEAPISGRYDLGGWDAILIHSTLPDIFKFWSTQPVCSVLIKSSTTVDEYDFGRGVFLAYNLGTSSGQDISNVRFCGCEDPKNDIPEFKIIATLAALAIVGIYIYKRRKNEKRH